MKNLVIVVAMMLATLNAYADNDADSFCMRAGDYAASAAHMRDRGVTETSLVESVRKNERLTKSEIEVSVSIIDAVFTGERLQAMTPNQVRADYVQFCRENYKP